MTTGSITKGDVSGDYYYTKTWSGQDGKYLDGSMKDNPYSMSVYSRLRSKGSRPHDINCRWDPYPNWVCDKACFYTEADIAYLANCNTSRSSTWTSNDELVLLSRLSAKIRRHSFNMGTFLAQGKQTVDQTISTIGALSSSLVALKRRQFGRALSLVGLAPGQRRISSLRRRVDSGDISGAWLAMQYGWLPFVSDVFEAWKAYEKLTAPPKTLSFVVTAKNSISWNGSAEPTNYTCNNRRVDSVRLKYTLTEELSAPRSLGLLDPASVAWELTPWSFVIDWFVPVGEYLEVLNVVPQLRGRWVRTEKAVTYESLGDILLEAYKICPFGTYLGFSKTINRTVGSSSLQVPLPSVKTLDKALSPTRIYNALALAHQRLK